VGCGGPKVRKTVQLGLSQGEIDLVIEAKNERKDILFPVYSQAGFTKGIKQRLAEHGASLVS